MKQIIINHRTRIFNLPILTQKRKMVFQIYWFLIKNPALESKSLAEIWQEVNNYYFEWFKVAKEHKKQPKISAQEMVNSAMRDYNYYKTSHAGTYFGD